MKLKKIISSLLVAAMAMSMSVLSFAANEDKYIFFDQAEYVEGENVTVNVYLNAEAKAVDTYTYLGITYGAEAFRFVSGSSSVTTATVTDYMEGVARWEEQSGNKQTIADATVPFITMEFEVIDPNKISDVPFAIISDDMYDNTSFSYDLGETNVMIGSSDVLDYLGTMTVTKKAPVTPEPPVDPEPPVQEEPETGDVIEVDGKTAVIDDAGKTRFVVEDTKASVGKTTAASILKVTYAGTTKQANLWNLLKVEEGATGEIAIGNLTVKVILGTDVIDANSVGSLSIAVQ